MFVCLSNLIFVSENFSSVYGEYYRSTSHPGRVLHGKNADRKMPFSQTLSLCNSPWTASPIKFIRILYCHPPELFDLSNSFKHTSRRQINGYRLTLHPYICRFFSIQVYFICKKWRTWEETHIVVWCKGVLSNIFCQSCLKET